MKDPLVDSEILHSGEGGDVEQWLEPRNNSFLFAIVSILFTCLLFIHHLSIFTHFNKIAIEYLNSYLEESQGEVQIPSRGIQLQFFFE